MLSEPLVKELQDIFSKKYKKKISIEEAKEIGENLVAFFEVLLSADMRQKGRGEKSS